MREASRRRLLSLVLPALLPSRLAVAADDPWAALRTPGHVALIRHALAPGNFDPAGFRLDDCSTQRNLSAEGFNVAGMRKNVTGWINAPVVAFWNIDKQ